MTGARSTRDPPINVCNSRDRNFKSRRYSTIQPPSDADSNAQCCSKRWNISVATADINVVREAQVRHGRKSSTMQACADGHVRRERLTFEPADLHCQNPRHKFRIAADIRNQIQQLSHSEFQVQTLSL